eukprot:GFUD01098089.1.p1 GENE.GFUD01098089.1~~GFUD01098089.1.p1  ORF type:complete len:402 (-),score=149.52 GFUD01098089.1:94-1299(-)
MSMNCLAGGTPVKSLTSNPRMALTRPERNQFLLGPVLAEPQSIPACVQLARQKNSLRNVVVKRYSLLQFLHGEVEEDPTVYILHEVTTMKQFQHPNIQPCLTSFVSDNEVWVVTPLMSYGSVKDLLSTHLADGLPELACCLVVRDLCQALQYLHRQGVVHRAVRASHVLVRDSGTAVLSGLRYSTPLQATGETRPNLYSYPLHGVTGNLAWLAPEILQQNLLGYNETSDIYSLAVTICEMANGVVPFSEMPPTLMLVEKLRGACPTLMDLSTVDPPTMQEGVDVGQPTDSGVGDSVGSFPTVLEGGATPAYHSRKYSPQFHHLVSQCSQLHSADRPAAQDLLAHPFIKQLRKTNTTLLTLIHPIQPLITTQEFSSEEEEEGGLVVELMEDLEVKEEAEWSF